MYFSISHVSRWTRADHRFEGQGINDLTLRVACTLLGTLTRVQTLPSLAYPARPTISIRQTCRHNVRVTSVRRLFLGRHKRTRTNGLVIIYGALAFGTPPVVFTWVLASLINACQIVRTLLVVSASHGFTFRERVTIVTGGTLALWLMIVRCTLRCFIAGGIMNARINTFAVVAASVQSTVDVTATCAFVTGEVWIAQIRRQTGADGFVVHQLTFGIHPAVAGISTETVYAGLAEYAV